VVTSALAGEGKTSTSINLAIALAQAGKRVILVDGDLRRPKVAELLSLERGVGLTTVLVGKASLSDSIQRHAASGADVLASGPLPPNPAEILQSQVTWELLERLRDVYDTVIVDAPPLLPVADAALMAADVDGALLVVQHGKTTQEQLSHAVTRLDQVGAKLFGNVVNMSPRRKRSSGYSYGYEPYGYAPVQDDREKPGWRKVSSES
jgi:capsular exopolysaccharide synthesis family protein